MEQKILRILLKNYTKIPYKGAIAKVIFDDCFKKMATEIIELVNENDPKSSVMASTPTVYLVNIDNEATVVIARNIAEAIDKAKKIAKEDYEMVYSKSLPLLY
jgi:hypothetical protein